MINEVLKLSEWCTTPFGRYIEDGGKASAQHYRDEYIVPAIKRQSNSREGMVVIDLDDMYPGYEYTTPFLHELFGGLIIHHGFTSDFLLGTILLKCKNQQVIHTSVQFMIDPYN